MEIRSICLNKSEIWHKFLVRDRKYVDTGVCLCFVCAFRIQLVFVWWIAYMCKFSLFSTAIHHRHPEPGMVDIYSGMVRMCLLWVRCQRQHVGCPLKSVNRRLPVKVGLFTFWAAVSPIFTAYFYCSCKNACCLSVVYPLIRCYVNSFLGLWPSSYCMVCSTTAGYTEVALHVFAQLFFYFAPEQYNCSF